MLTHGPWTAIPGMRHGFLERSDCEPVRDWSSVVAAAGVHVPVVTVQQVHGTRVVQAPIDGAPPEADAIVTANPGLVVGVVTADCAPILLVAPAHGAVAALHAGWRGAAEGVVEAALGHLADDLGVAPGHVEAVIGPAVGPCCYEVGIEVSDAFRARTGRVTHSAWAQRNGRLVLDLRAALRALLMDRGVPSVSLVGPCTACSPRFSSYRRQGAGCGRQLSFIGWA